MLIEIDSRGQDIGLGIFVYNTATNAVSCNHCKTQSSQSVIDIIEVKLSLGKAVKSYKTRCGLCSAELREFSEVASHQLDQLNFNESLFQFNQTAVSLNGKNCVIPKHNLERCLILEFFESNNNFIPYYRGYLVSSISYRCSDCQVPLFTFSRQIPDQIDMTQFKLRASISISHGIAGFWLEEWNRVACFGDASVAIP